jgi:AcrR family transcriptional regulator
MNIEFIIEDDLMQVLKDEVKERIDRAALELFAEKGYGNTTMAEIAGRAGISVGNIYLYYKKKESLFKAVIPEDFLLKFKSYLGKKILAAPGEAINGLENNPLHLLAKEEMLDFCCENRLKLIAVFDKGEGTIYANAKKDFLEYTVGLFYKYLESLPDQPAKEKFKEIRPLAQLIYINLFNCIFEIFKHFITKEELRQAIAQILTYHLYGLNGLMT